jgi:hypothetical protein
LAAYCRFLPLSVRFSCPQTKQAKCKTPFVYKGIAG